MRTLLQIMQLFESRPGGTSGMFNVDAVRAAIREAYDLGIKVGEKAKAPEPKSKGDLIEHMLGEIEDDLSEKGRDNPFMLSLREQFDSRGTLSDKQFQALENFYERIG